LKHERWFDYRIKSANASGGSHGVWKQVSVTLRARARLRRQQKARARAQRLKYVSAEQLVYADILESGLTIGRYFLAITFALYLLGITTPKVPLSELPANWSLPAEQYSYLVGVEAGWGWLKLVHFGDYMNFLGIAFLASVTIICYLRLLPISLRSKNRPFTAILFAEIILLFLAASGLLAIGH